MSALHFLVLAQKRALSRVVIASITIYTVKEKSDSLARMHIFGTKYPPVIGTYVDTVPGKKHYQGQNCDIVGIKVHEQ